LAAHAADDIVGKVGKESDNNKKNDGLSPKKMQNAMQNCAEKNKSIVKLTIVVTFAIVIIIYHVFTFSF
jgi:hypothetical protein